MRTVLGSGSALVLGSTPYLRVVFVLIGAGLALAVGVVAFTLLGLASEAGAPLWVLGWGAVVLVGGPLAVGLVPAVRQVEGVAAQTLLVVRFPDGAPGPANGWSERIRAEGWFLLHLLAGLGVSAAVFGVVALRGRAWMVPATVATVLVTLLLGRLLAALAPTLLGPSYAERLERLEANAARATERNRLAREMHDSIGHALSLVTVQAAAARRVMDRDPEFAEQALDAIETTSRRAAADLDHLLGLLRDDRAGRPAVAPSPDLGSLGALVGAARSAGLVVEETVSGDLSTLPLLVSREAYRIVQEGLTNAVKYSADRAAILRLSLERDTLDIRLSNLTSDLVSLREGRGLRGIDERAATLGGSVSAGTEDDRWTLAVSLPTWTSS
ncbi:MAG: histidine kinase [Nocardioides sp.]